MEQDRHSIQLSHLFCEYNNFAKLLCCKQNCYNCSFVCRHQQCNCLSNKHQQCEFIYAQTIVKKIMKKKRVLTKELQNGFKAVERVYEQIIDQLSKDREKLVAWKENYGLSEIEAKFITAIMENNKTQLVGDFVAKIKNQLNFKDQISEQWFNEIVFKQFWNKKVSQLDQIRKQLTNFYQSSLSFSGKISYIIDNNVLKNGYFIQDQKTKIIQKINGDSEWSLITNNQPLPKYNKLSFEVTIKQTKNWNIIVGIITEKGKSLINAYNTLETVCYYLNDGIVFERGNQIMPKRIRRSREYSKSARLFKPGDKIQIKIDRVQKKIVWSVNQLILASNNIDELFLVNEIYLFVQTYNVGDKIILGSQN